MRLFRHLLTHILAHVDDFVGMRAFAHQISQTEYATDTAAFDVLQSRFEGRDIAV